MAVNTQMVEQLALQVEQLPPDARLQLVQRILQSLRPALGKEPSRKLRFGEFAGDPAAMSTVEDFKLAEWHPTDEELNGA